MKRIMVAEDNKLILETIYHSLTREGYEIIKAADGKECLRLLENTEVDLVCAKYGSCLRAGKRTDITYKKEMFHNFFSPFIMRFVFIHLVPIRTFFNSNF